MVLLAPGVGMLAAATFVLGGTFAAWSVPPAILLRSVPVAAQARTMGLFRFVADVGFLVAPVVMAWVYGRTGIGGAAVVAAAVPLGAMAALLAGRRGEVP
jgi:hypothetical protein